MARPKGAVSDASKWHQARPGERQGKGAKMCQVLGVPGTGGPQLIIGPDRSREAGAAKELLAVHLTWTTSDVCRTRSSVCLAVIARILPMYLTRVAETGWVGCRGGAHEQPQSPCPCSAVDVMLSNPRAGLPGQVCITWHARKRLASPHTSTCSAVEASQVKSVLSSQVLASQVNLLQHLSLRSRASWCCWWSHSQ